MKILFFGLVFSAIFPLKNVNAQTYCFTNNPYGMTNAQKEACHRQQDREMMDKMRLEGDNRKRATENDNKNQLIVEGCASNINASSSISDFEIAIECLSNNRYAGIKHVEIFLNSSKEILNGFSESNSKDFLHKKISDLQKKKQPNYWLIINHATGSREVLVADY